MFYLNLLGHVLASLVLLIIGTALPVQGTIAIGVIAAVWWLGLLTALVLHLVRELRARFRSSLYRR